MKQRNQQGKKKGGSRKHGRSKIKANARGGPLSQYVRGRISFEKYWKMVKK